MKQTRLDLTLSVKRTRKQEFLAQMECIVPWSALVELIAPYYPEGKNGRPPFALETMLRIHFMQQWFSLSDPAMQEAFFDVPLYRQFAQLDAHGRLPDESTILRFRHRLERHKLADQILATVNDLLSARGLLLKAVWLREGALPGIEEEHAAAQHAVCAVKPVDGAPYVDGDAGMSAPKNRTRTANAAEMLPAGSEKA